MSQVFRRRMLGGGLAVLAWAVANIGHAESPVDYRAEIQPIFEANCYSCHGPTRQRGKLRLDVKAEVFKGEREEWVIQPGDAAGSELVRLISLPHDDIDIMPPDEDPLTEAQIVLIRQWIDQGADWPEESVSQPASVAGQTFELKELTEDQAAAQVQAVRAVTESGGSAVRLAADSQAMEVNFSLAGQAIVDEHLGVLTDLRYTLVWLNLARTGVSDTGLAHLKELTELRRLHLQNTPITDAGLAHLAPLHKLEYLNLYGTAITDAGLIHLTQLKSLRRLYLWRTQVSDAGVAALAQVLPELTIDTGRHTPVTRVSGEAEAPRDPEAQP